VVVAFVLFTAAGLGVEGYLQWHNQETQSSQTKQQSEQELQGICHTLGAIAALKPPAGNGSENPSREYEQRFHAVIDQLRPDLGCTPARS
jgi:single-stranded DNA-binding protein